MAVVMLLLFGTVEDLLDSVYGLLLGIFLLSNFLRSTLRPFRALRIDSILCFNRTLASFGGDRYLGLKLRVRRSVLLVAVLDDVACGDLPTLCNRTCEIGGTVFVGLTTVI
jgi:hypothetical protein